jgi:hypothetical protein
MRTVEYIWEDILTATLLTLEMYEGLQRDNETTLTAHCGISVMIVARSSGAAADTLPAIARTERTIGKKARKYIA